LGVPAGAVVVLFSGSFRPWHGVHVLEGGRDRCARVPICTSCSRAAARRAWPEGYAGRRLGTVPYAEMPEIVAAADVGVAPYDPARLPQLALGLLLVALKIFEYMASGLPPSPSRARR